MNNSEVTNQNNISTPIQPQTSIQTQTKTSKKNIMISIIIVVALILITGIYFLIEYLNPKIEINNVLPAKEKVGIKLDLKIPKLFRILFNF